MRGLALFLAGAVAAAGAYAVGGRIITVRETHKRWRKHRPSVYGG